MDIEIEYQEALDYLYRFIDYSLTRSFRYTPDKFDLPRMVELMDRFGNPHHNYPIIHVAGTKGKGSVSALCASALHAAGYRVGFYTSPHLQQYTERIQVNGANIPHGDFVDIVNEIKPHVAAIPHLTTFELTTAVGFIYFARQAVDAAVIEVGLGGRLDATNIVTPMVSVITSLSYDHMNVLGDTLEKIAGEKAGIIKPGRPVVLAPQKDEARKVVERIARERQSPLVQIGRDYLYKSIAHSLDQQTLQVWQPHEDGAFDNRRIIGETGQPVSLTIPLLGFHQVENAATAYAALDIFGRDSLSLSLSDIQTGFKQVIWPGRFEVLQHHPPVIVDSAHNPDSALRLQQALDDYLPGWPVVLVFGASEDKDVPGMFAHLLPRISLLITTQSVHPRAMDAVALANLASKYECPIKITETVEEALHLAVKSAGDQAAILVAGSLFVAAAAREIWYQENDLHKTEEHMVAARDPGVQKDEK